MRGEDRLSVEVRVRKRMHTTEAKCFTLGIVARISPSEIGNFSFKNVSSSSDLLLKPSRVLVILLVEVANSPETTPETPVKFFFL